jgi:hypothetical protein
MTGRTLCFRSQAAFRMMCTARSSSLPMTVGVMLPLGNILGTSVCWGSGPRNKIRAAIAALVRQWSGSPAGQAHAHVLGAEQTLGQMAYL